MFEVSIISSEPTFYLLTIFVLGLIVGSFVNVVAYRIPIMMHKAVEQDYLALQTPDDSASLDQSREAVFNLALPASRCPDCGAPIQIWQNIPIISWVLLKGKCANCRSPISARYPMVELATAVLSLVVVLVVGPTLKAAGLLLFTWFLIALTLIDIDEYLLPDSLTLPLVWAGLLINSFGVFTSLENAVYGAALGYMSLWSVFWLFKLVTGKEGMGFGDFKLLAAIGAFLGWQAVPLVILLSSLVGAIVGITCIIALGRDKNIPIPFGPYLAAAGWIAALWGDTITSQYLQFIGIH